MTTLGSFWDRALFTWLHRTVWCGIPPSLPFHLLSREKNHTPTISHNTRQTERWNIRRWTRCHAVRLSPSISLSLSLVTCCALVLLNVCPSHRSKSCSPAPQLHGQTVQINPVTAGVNNTGIFTHLG